MRTLCLQGICAATCCTNSSSGYASAKARLYLLEVTQDFSEGKYKCDGFWGGRSLLEGSWALLKIDGFLVIGSDGRG